MIRVLVVDDHPAVRASLSAVVNSADALTVVGEGADGDEALDLATLLRPDLVLMDVRMPKTDGIEATRRLKALDSPPKVVLISAYEEDDLESAGRRAGADDFLVKGTAARHILRQLLAVVA